MEPYSNLEYTEKSYDYYNYDYGRYIDLNVINFYHDIEEDYEDDDWVFNIRMNQVMKDILKIYQH